MGRHRADAASAVSGEDPGQTGGFSAAGADGQPTLDRPAPPPGDRRRVAVAVGVALLGVILLVFGFISLTTTNDPPIASSQDATQGTQGESTVVPPVTTLPPLPTTSSAGPSTPEMLPVTVLNNSPHLTAGLATRVADALGAGGWPIAELLNYSDTQPSATTVYFTSGNAAEEAAAQALVEQFPEIEGGVEPRFDGLPGTGLTVAAVGDWVP